MSENGNEEQDWTIEEIALSTMYQVEALIQVLLAKGVITQDELDSKVEQIQEEIENDDEDEEGGNLLI